MQIQILDDAGQPWATLHPRDATQSGPQWVDEDGDLLPDNYQDALNDLQAAVREDPYWTVLVNRGQLSK